VVAVLITATVRFPDSDTIVNGPIRGTNGFPVGSRMSNMTGHFPALGSIINTNANDTGSPKLFTVMDTLGVSPKKPSNESLPLTSSLTASQTRQLVMLGNGMHGLMDDYCVVGARLRRGRP